ncbi:alpha-L-arabinofuranosidase A [Aspergillus clavatus NRRL 1]|uniref:non-reducing end alpha-L-arabinofuranosidase n=1 Tax=Aspergillus clavatus (strain ATCC 1007 / CBS 513.65 / DSM 816 / NCTC 3887 / NRRL 1 / QM 1276 / 107) TaxID=344612 RepID=A1C7K4_ASPCL|nr:alpha-L-arabinofuranosidase A [Aspergillus clavatus NRRL 1]EAW14375.1 alpha-L-arabinofuranosidase A [Aspergillus clavatus NRRL 1]
MVLPKLLLLPLLAACSAAVKISVASFGGNVTTGLQYGIMEEDINHCGEGGLYAELIRNRAFQGGSNDPLSSTLPTSVNVKGSKGEVGLANSGWWGIDVRPQKYTGPFYVKGAYMGSFTASLQSSTNGKVFARTKVTSHSVGDEWTQHSFTLVPHSPPPNTNNTFSITFDASKAEGGALDFNLISLFPPTWNDRPNGLRKDLMQAMKDFAPVSILAAGLRLSIFNDKSRNSSVSLVEITSRARLSKPGGSGTKRLVPSRTDLVVPRPGDTKRPGLGLIEYMEWCDNLEIEPILAVWAGLALNGDVIPESELGMFIKDALDEIEFLTGSVDTKYGALRASLGYPKPWNIRYVEVGNEDNLSNGLATYKSYRFQAFYDGIKAKYPDITVIASTIDMTLPDEAGGDYHLYDVPDNFVSRFNFFDNFSEDHPILLGEVAATVQNNGHGIDWGITKFSLYPWWIGTVAEAVLLIGTERNANKIIGTTYAPLLMNLDNYHWSPTLIAFNSNPDQTARSTSWHLYDVFSHNHITNTLPTKASDDFGPLYYVAGLDNSTNTHIFKAAVYNSTADVPISLTFDGVRPGTTAQLTVLTAPDAVSMNEVGGADLVHRKVSTLRAGKRGVFDFKLPNLSVAVLKTL